MLAKQFINMYKQTLTGMKFVLVLSLALACGMPAPASARGGVDPDPTQNSHRIVVSGVVKDDECNPLIGASIRSNADRQYAVTDADGKFQITVSSQAVLEVSYLGFKTMEIPVNNQKHLEVVLTNNMSHLNEVVVVGYGVQKKVNLSGAVDQIGAADLAKRPINDLSKGLQGMIPNLNIDFTSGEPGQQANINIRGEASINGGSPLILIDGVAADVSELNRILPEDIESLSVLKDASSAAIYGARAAFGVILITTKQGKSGKIQVDYNNNFKWKRPTILTDHTSDPYIYLKLKNIAVLNTPWSAGHVTSDERLEWARQRSDDPDNTPAIRLDPLDNTQWDYMGNTDWTRYFLDKSTFSHSHQASVSGATERSKFYLSAGYEGENGVFSDIVTHDYYRRYSMRSHVTYRLASWLSLSNNTSYVLTDRRKPSHYNISDIFDAEPHNVDRNEDGTWANTELGHTLAQMVDGGDQRTKYSKLQSTFSAEASFWNRMLVVNANFTFTKGHEDDDWFETPYQVEYGPEDIRQLGQSRSWKSSTSDDYTVFEIFGTFNKSFHKLHHVTAITGFNQEYSRSDNFTAERYDIISGTLPSINLASGQQQVTEKYTDWAIRGLFFRLNYIYANKYILEVNGRYDGTSRFPKKKRFGFFPSASLAWRVDEEKWFDPLRKVVSQLKLRASYGSLGNQLVSAYGYIPYLSSKVSSYVVGGTRPQVVTSPDLVSEDYTWETVRTLNGGIDLGLFDNKLSLTFDIFRRDTRGMLTLGKQLPSVLGKTEPMENAANQRTKGWELSIAYRDAFQLAAKPFNYSVKFVLSDSKTHITKFDNPDRLLSQYYEGQEIGEIWGLTSDGLFKDNDEIAKLDESEIIPWGALTIVPGWPKYKDLNGDQKITKGTTVDDPGDLRIIGNSSPRYRFGFNFSAEWNGFDISGFVQGIGKRDYYPLSYLYWSFFQQPYSGGQKHCFDFYRPQTDDAATMAQHSQSYIKAGLADQNLDSKYPVLQCWLADKNLGTDINHAMGMAIPQTRYLLNGAYLRLKNLTLGYTLPKEWTEKLHLSRVRIYVSGDNLFEISELRKYFDPEAVTDTSTYGYTYPFNRQYSFGLNVTF
jgi:TonB-linked SusC/RagA family outer membrane protein